MALTVNTAPNANSNTSIWDVTTSLSEDASHVNLRIRGEVIVSAVTKIKTEQPKGLDDFIYTDGLLGLLSGYSPSLTSRVVTENLSDFVSYTVKFTEVWETAAGVNTTGDTDTSSTKVFYQCDVDTFDDYLIDNVADRSKKFLTDNHNREIYAPSNLISSWTDVLVPYFDYLREDGVDLTFVQNSAGTLEQTTSNVFSMNIGDKVYLYGYMYKSSGTLDATAHLICNSVDSKRYSLAEGFNVIELTAIEQGSTTLRIEQTQACDFSFINTRLVRIPYSSINLSNIMDLSSSRAYKFEPVTENLFYIGGNGETNLITGWTNIDVNAFSSSGSTAWNIDVGLGGPEEARTTNDLGAITSSQFLNVEYHYNPQVSGAAEIRLYDDTSKTTALTASYELLSGYNRATINVTTSAATSYLFLTEVFNDSVLGSLLYINAQILDDSLAEDKVNIPIGNIIYPFIDTWKITAWDFTNSAIMSELYYIEQTTKCYDNPITLEWQNNEGGYDTYTFNADLSKFHKGKPVFYTDDGQVNKKLKANKFESMSLSSKDELPNVIQWLSTILDSTDVNLIEGSTRTNVTVLNNSKKIAEKFTKLQISFDIEYES
jgi:hypothetical protein